MNYRKLKLCINNSATLYYQVLTEEVQTKEEFEEMKQYFIYKLSGVLDMISQFGTDGINILNDSQTDRVIKNITLVIETFRSEEFESRGRWKGRVFGMRY